MKGTRRAPRFALSIWLVAAVAAAHSAEEKDPIEAESARIEALLEAVAASQDAFIRNGKEHSGQEAAAHLSAKWKALSEHLKTAEDFVRLCGTQSESSGQVYRVKRAADGSEADLADWLGGELKRLGQAQPAAAHPTSEASPLLDALGHESYEEREKATEALVRQGEAARAAVEACAQETQDPEVKARCAKILQAIGDPNKTGIHVLEMLESAEVRIKRPGAWLRKEFDGKGFAAHLRGKAILDQMELTMPARAFIEKLATKSGLHGTVYLVILPDGAETELAPWLREQLKLKDEDE